MRIALVVREMRKIARALGKRRFSLYICGRNLINLITRIMNQNNGEITLYQPDSSIRLEVRMHEETVWLTQAQMTMLFQTTKQNISLHIGNIFKEGELDKNSVVKDFLTTAADGKNYRTRYYNLDVITSVGYRIKNIQGTRFRQWANSVLRDYLLRGCAINQRFE